MNQESLEITMYPPATYSDEYIQVYGGKNYFLLLKSGKLYGLGRNEYGQLCRKTVPYVFEPKLIATGVISAAAGWRFSGFVNANGEVNVVHAGDIFAVPGVSNITKIFSASSVFYVIDRDGNVFVIEAEENYFSYPKKVKFKVRPMSDTMKDELSINQFHMCRPIALDIAHYKNIDVSEYKKIVKGKMHSMAVALKTDGSVDFLEYFGKFGCNYEFRDITDIAVSENEDFLFSTKNNEILYVNAGFSAPLKSLREFKWKDARSERKLRVDIKRFILP